MRKRASKEQRAIWQKNYLERHPGKAEELRKKQLDRHNWRYHNDPEYRERHKKAAKLHWENNKDAIKARRKTNEKRKAYERQYNATHRLQTRNAWLKARYGITLAEFEVMSEAQGHVCAICQKPEKNPDRWGSPHRRLRVDHDHTSGKVRGLLCHHCNAAIGHMMDNPNILRRAAAYLERGCVT